MERCFSMEAKNFSFSAKADAFELRLEERRKGFCGYLFLGFQCFEWLLAMVEETLKAPMVCGGGNKGGRYLEVADYVEGDR
jgi:hypothetical protein